MKKRLEIVLRLTMAIMISVLTFSMVAFAEDTTRFVGGTSVNGISISGLTVEEAKEKMIAHYVSNYRLTLIRKGGTPEYINGGDIGYQAVIPDELQSILNNQNETGRNSGPAAESSRTITVTGTFDETALAAKIQELACVSGSNVQVTSNARISDYQAGQKFKIIAEVYGNSINVERLTGTVKAALAAGQAEVKLNEAGCYDEVTVTSTDEQLTNRCNTMNQCGQMAITYTFGEETTETLTGEVISTWITGQEDGQIGINRDLAGAYIKSLADKYDTVGVTRIFRTTAGNDVELTGPFGWKLNQAAEIDALIAMINTGETQSREPQYVQAAVSRTAPDWGNTYVEIDLTGQHVYMYQEGNLVWDAPCVTGNTSKNYTTPPGIFGLTYKETDRILRGKKLENGKYEYESHVDYWMPFNGGIGLHDANWRGKFGGTIYQKGGSHGCINLPPERAKVLYGLVYKGIPVICYN